MPKQHHSKQICTTQIYQIFRNTEKNPIESEYVFPISDDSVVTSLEVKLDDGRILTAKIEEETKANEDYEDSVASGHTAYMAKKTAPDRMVLSIGNLPQDVGQRFW